MKMEIKTKGMKRLRHLGVGLMMVLGAAGPLGAEEAMDSAGIPEDSSEAPVRGLAEGVTVSTLVGSTQFDGRTAGLWTVRGSLEVLSWLDLTWEGAAVHTLERRYDDGAGRSYQAEAAWSGFGLRPHWGLGSRVEIGLPISSAMGIVQYRYEREYREEMVWSEEFLDRLHPAVTTAGADLRIRLWDGMTAAAEGGWRMSSPLESPYAGKGDLSSWYAGLRLGYQL